MVAFAAEMQALQACCEQAIEAGFLASQDKLAKSVAAWARDAENMTEALRKLDSRVTLGVARRPDKTVIGAVVAEAIPFAEREKPQSQNEKPEGQTVAQKIIAERAAPEIPDLGDLKALLEGEEIKNKVTISRFIKVLGSEQILTNKERDSHAEAMFSEVTKLKAAMGKVESGNAANLGVLTSALEVLHTHTEKLLELIRDRIFEKFGFPQAEPLPPDAERSKDDPIDAAIALQKLHADLGNQRIALAAGRAR